LVQNLYHDPDGYAVPHSLSDPLGLSDSYKYSNRIGKWLLYKHTHPDGHGLPDRFFYYYRIRHTDWI
jgi:hypothetical protein